MNKKTALVVGGSGGIGIEIIKTFLESGIKVCATYCNNKKKLEELQEISKKEILIYKMDITDETSVKSAFNQILTDHNQIDIVVLSVAYPMKNKHVLNVEWKEFQEQLDIHTKGLVYVVQNLKEKIKAGHKIKFVILLTEACIGKPPAGLSHYVTAKYSLMGLAKSMAVELAKYNCTVNMVSPGMVDTSLISTFPPKMIELTAESNPLKRIATPKDIANVVLFLSKDDSDYLNGVNITVNGGGIML